MPPIYIFENFVPLLIGGPLIAIAAVFGSVRALMPCDLWLAERLAEA